MNKCMLLGRLTKDPEIRLLQNGETKVARYTLAVKRPGTKNNDADFFTCNAIGKNAEFAERFLQKGKMILVEGSFQNRHWTDSNGQKRYTTEFYTEQHFFTESKGSSTANETPQHNEQPYVPNDIGSSNTDIIDDDLPF